MRSGLGSAGSTRGARSAISHRRRLRRESCGQCRRRRCCVRRGRHDRWAGARQFHIAHGVTPARSIPYDVELLGAGSRPRGAGVQASRSSRVPEGGKSGPHAPVYGLALAHEGSLGLGGSRGVLGRVAARRRRYFPEISRPLGDARRSLPALTRGHRCRVSGKLPHQLRGERFPHEPVEPRADCAVWRTAARHFVHMTGGGSHIMRRSLARSVSPPCSAIPQRPASTGLAADRQEGLARKKKDARAMATNVRTRGASFP